MTDQRTLAASFEELAALLEITGANSFRISATRRVVGILEDFDGDLCETAQTPGALEAIDGIGKGSAERIRAWCQTGQIEELETLRDEVPSGLIDLLNISGLGPKTVGRLWREADVIDRVTLREAIDEGRLADLPRMGAKTIANISDALAFAEQTADRTSIGIAMPLAESIVSQLQEIPGTSHVQYAGSLRRGRETIGDIDVLACTDQPTELISAFSNMEEVDKVLAAGDTKASIRHRAGIQIDLRVVSEDSVGAALLYFTGSKEHNVSMRQKAQQQGQRLNEYGLFAEDDEDRKDPIACRTEADIYAALGLPEHPPELREPTDDITSSPPKLIEQCQIISDLHTHTVASDGVLTIRELADAALARGLKVLAITDHSRSSVQANGLSEDRLLAHIDAIHEANESVDGITLLAGSEVDIHADGRLDYEDHVLEKLDLVIASPHAALTQPSDQATPRLLAAIRHPLVHIIGHPTGRMIGRRPGLDVDIHAICAAAAEHRTALEINANPSRLDLRDRHVRVAMEHGTLISINTDAHAADHLDFLRYGILTARRGGATADACINTWSAAQLRSWTS